MSSDWSLSTVWNAGIAKPSEPNTPRDYLWATELGKSPIDVYHRLRGEQYTNPPNLRSRRKFEAGNTFEWLVGLILKRSGLILDEQVRSVHQYPGLLEVTGYADFLAGGKPDFAKGIAELKSLALPEVYIEIAEALQKHFEEQGNPELRTKMLEVKSVGAYMYESMEKKKVGMKQHRMQLFHYLKSHGLEQGSIVYISRDDLRIFEVPIFNTEKYEEEYRTAIENLSYYYLNGIEPEKEAMVVYDEDSGRFSTNWRVAYSGYLKKLYGYDTQADYDKANKALPPRWNRVLTRFKKGEKMTTKNIEVIKEMAEAGFDVPNIAKSFVAATEEEPTE